ncbi:LysR family transcriptional regulator [Kordiimonas marina]|uniref:LysR family transcriptional regulator n=1 Tax=Kordiimonas marina TaxID=2872312 RepID=UPI001FF3D9CD|nr:LysR family transcriptional regulator [Kordiimonas marina]MCJ9430670.1 LysR family transcriptional regulator [Kordiimonas marina]
MDIDHARTFLAVVDTGSFVAAAEKIYVTQSTVSMRIKVLEQQLGQTLFERSKAGASLTPAGRQFQKHARAFIKIWQQAKLEVALPEGHDVAITIGAQPSLWHGYVLNFLPWMRAAAPHVALRTQMAAASELLMERLNNGVLDLAILYRPVPRPGIRIAQLFEEHLVMVSNGPEGVRAEGAGLPPDDYVYVDWGPEFRADHSLNFPDLILPGLHLDVGTLGIDYLLENPASGYFPLRIAAPHIAAGRLHTVGDAPTFSYRTYAAYSEEADAAVMATALEGLRTIAEEQVPMNAGDAVEG